MAEQAGKQGEGVMSEAHGHVFPNANGLKARCGGPALCVVCRAEQRGRQQGLREAFDIAASWATHFEENTQTPGKFAALNLEKQVAAQCIRNEIGQLREQE
jgi:hypothetical protein